MLVVESVVEEWGKLMKNNTQYVRLAINETNLASKEIKKIGDD